jgi:hypothetical protein
VRTDHGSLIIGDSENADDLSEWDPVESPWYSGRQSIIFGVLPASEGWVECEIWNGVPEAPLPYRLFEVAIVVDSGWLVLHDPNEDARIRFRRKRGTVTISALVDDLAFASRVQLSLTDAEGQPTERD